MSATIRPAAPGDAEKVARLMYLAGKSHVETSIYDLMFAGTLEYSLDLLEGLFSAVTISMFHHSFYLVAEVDGGAAGSLSGYCQLEAGGRKVRNALEEIGWWSSNGKTMVERMKPVYSVYPTHPKEAWIIENVAVFPEFRRMGLVNSLLEEILEKGRKTGYRCAELSMFTGNLPAQRAYEKVGFSVVAENTDPEFEKIFGCPGMSRMIVEL